MDKWVHGGAVHWDWVYQKRNKCVCVWGKGWVEKMEYVEPEFILGLLDRDM